MVTLPQVAETMRTVLTTVADSAGRQTSFVQRESKCSGSIFTQTLVFTLLQHAQASLEQFAQTAAGLGVEITPQALDQRFSHEAAQCLEQVLTAAMRTVVATDPVAIPLLERFQGVFIQDSTTIVLPSELAELWQGCGGNTDHGNAAVKLQVQLDLASGRMLAQLQQGRDADYNSTLDMNIPSGGVRIADLGYWNLKRLSDLHQRGVFWFSRAHATTAIQTEDGKWWKLLELLEANEQATTLDMPVRLGKTVGLPARLLARRVPQEVADQRRRRLRAEARDEGKTVSALRLALAAWTIFVTNIPPELLTLTEAVVLGRARWQIELIFKLWKSHGQVDEIQKVKKWRVLCEMFAKLLGQIIQHWLLLVCCWQEVARSITKAAQTIRSHVMCIVTSMRSKVKLIDAIKSLESCIHAGCRINPRQKRPNTYQLLLEVTEGVLA